jgi:CheY-like chemotaxis protein
VKVLLVEDNELNRDMLSRRLARRGYEVILAMDGEEAVGKALAERPAIILMDLSLPVLDGWEATRRLKTDDRTCRIPIIALSAHALTDDADRARRAGCDDFDTKPVDFARLLVKMDACLSRGAGSGRPEALPPGSRAKE